jgi:predicted kinase
MDITKIASEVSEDMLSHSQPVGNPVVIVLVGLQYAGKSYLAERIVSRNYAHFWATNIKKQYSIANQEMIKVANEVLKVVIAEHRNVIIDFVNHKYSIRKQFQDIVQSLGVNYKVVFLDTPKEKRLSRREENVKIGDMPGRRIISLEQMEQFENEFEIPMNDENLVTLKTQDDIERFIENL